LLGDDTGFTCLSIDSRTVNEGDVYLALKGERFDGHEFIVDALRKGCAGVIGEQDLASVSQYIEDEGMTAKQISYLQVNDTDKALASIASLNRQRFCGKLVGLTGSAGKTSTKNMLKAVLSEYGKTAATKGNFNNEVGVPLTLLDINAEHQFSVVEMGARAKGDIAYLSNMARPDVAMVLNAGSAHIEVFGDYEAIVEGKGEIYDSLSADGVGIINFDDPAYMTWLERLGGRQSLSFSQESENADVFASDVECEAEGSCFTLNYHEESVRVGLPVPGLHQIQNALAAATAAIAVGCDLEGVAKGLAKVESTEGRMNTAFINDITLLDDSYNANPASMKAALNVLSMQAGYRIAVLGEMAELGAHAHDAHIDVATYALELGIEEFCLIGQYAKQMSESIGENALVFEDKALLAEHLVKDQHKNKIVMIKGSRSAAMDEVVNLIKRRVH
ncbi:UDP-N-acetylmuramoyl-tripeptide--D-alanyl-D-alanine ligase, partial [Oleiphilus sp. HI0043]|uniref:UDP-N-acetylmuramoyl-tripeptide--D-alanyl-D- alanine ligase n=4 Tax=Oleiphilus TaxID=141450 RepID=UPI000AFA2907